MDHNYVIPMVNECNQPNLFHLLCMQHHLTKYNFLYLFLNYPETLLFTCLCYLENGRSWITI